jgi:hypothetical protein
LESSHRAHHGLNLVSYPESFNFWDIRAEQERALESPHATKHDEGLDFSCNSTILNDDGMIMERW